MLDFFFKRELQEKYIKFVSRFYILIIIIAVALTIVAINLTLKLKLKADFAALLPDDSIAVQKLREIDKKVGGIGVVEVLVESKDLNASIKFAKDIAPKLEQIKEIDFVVYKMSEVKSFFKKNRALFAEIDDLKEIHKSLDTRIKEEKLKKSGLYLDLEEEDDGKTKPIFDFESLKRKYSSEYTNRDYLVTKDNAVLAILCKPIGTATSIKFAKHIRSQVNNVVKKYDLAQYHPSMKVNLRGSFISQIKQHDMVLNDLKKAGYIAFLGVLLFLIIFFRKLVGIFTVLIPLVMSILWTLAITYLAIGNINTMTGFMFAILLGLGIDFGIHMFGRLREEKSQGKSTHEALLLVIMHTGKANLTSAITTSIAFYALQITKFKGFDEFGFIAGTGVLICIFAMLILFPANVFLFEKLKLLKFKQKTSVIKYDKKFPIPKTIFFIGIIITILSIAATFSGNVRFDYNFKNVSTRDPVQEAMNKKVGKIYGRSLSPAVIVAKKDKIKEIEKIINDKRKNLGKDSPIQGVWTVYSLLPKNQDEKLVEISKIRKLLEDDALTLIKDQKIQDNIKKFREELHLKKLTINDLPYFIKKFFTGIDGSFGEFAYIFSSTELWDALDTKRFYDQVKMIETADGSKHYASGSPIIFSEVVLSIVKHGKIAILASLIAVFLLILIDFRSFKGALLVMLPLLAGMFWMGGIMYLFGLNINFFNIIVIPTMIGIGIDNGVHIYHRYIKEGAGSVYKTFRTTGIASAMCTLTTMAGFSSLLFITHRGLFNIGRLAVIGLGACLITSVFFLPAILEVIEKTTDKRLK